MSPRLLGVLGPSVWLAPSLGPAEHRPPRDGPTSVDRISRAGSVDGPPHLIKPFGFEMGKYALESEHACFTSPELTMARTQLLDYFEAQKAFLEPDHTVFSFENTMQFDNNTSPEALLLKQLCFATGHNNFSQNPADPTLVRYLTGENGELMDYFPELGFFRDIVFLFPP